MLTQISTVKARLALTVTDYDDLLTTAIRAVSARFDKETNRTLARTTTATHEFDAADTEILPPCYPIEAVTKFVGKQVSRAYFSNYAQSISGRARAVVGRFPDLRSLRPLRVPRGGF